jgi:phospholipase C
VPAGRRVRPSIVQPSGTGRARRWPFSRAAAVVLLSGLVATCATSVPVRGPVATSAPSAAEAGSGRIPETDRRPLSASLPALSTQRPPVPQRGGRVTGIHKIRHVIIIMQENRSFDSYFGTYPGADGPDRPQDTIAVTASAIRRAYCAASSWLA